jgi:glucose 1-dehydrogenase
MKLLGKKALVTGAARGIGKGCALALARAGADVAVNDRAQSPAALEVVAAIQGLGRASVLAEGDAFEPPACETIVERAVEAFGHLDILVSNPAMNARCEFLDYDPATFERVLRAVLFGGFCMSRLVARHMVARGAGGKIVFISSVHARVGYAGSVAYNAGKAGLNHMALTIAAELAPYRINVNLIEPGWIDTPGEREAFGDSKIEEAGATLPWGRMGTPEDIGRAAVFLASDDAEYVTGAALLVDGGLLLRAARE